MDFVRELDYEREEKPHLECLVAISGVFAGAGKHANGFVPGIMNLTIYRVKQAAHTYPSVTDPKSSFIFSSKGLAKYSSIASRTLSLSEII